MAWQEDMIAELRCIDREQATHGLYGLRDALKKGDRLPPLAAILFEKPRATNLPGRLGWDGRAGSFQNTAFFTVPGVAKADLTLVTHASTKVRHYGGSYVLDKVHGKKGVDFPDLESMVPKLARARYHHPNINALLLIAHAPTERQLMSLLGRSLRPDFMSRYGVSLVFDVWEDIYQREFHSGVFLWTADLETK